MRQLQFHALVLLFSGSSATRLLSSKFPVSSSVPLSAFHNAHVEKFQRNTTSTGMVNHVRISAFSSSGVCEAIFGIKKSKTKKSKGGSCIKEEDKGKDNQKKHMSHGTLWFIEKIISAALIVTIPLAIAAPNPLFDLILITVLMPHIHWGIVATVIDYARPIILGATGAMIAYYACFAISAFIALGLLHLALKGQGIGNSVQTLWSMGSKN